MQTVEVWRGSLCKRWTNFPTRKLSERLKTFRRTRAETYPFQAKENYSLHKVLWSLLNIKSNIENKIPFIWKQYAFEARDGVTVISTPLRYTCGLSHFLIHERIRRNFTSRRIEGNSLIHYSQEYIFLEHPMPLLNIPSTQSEFC